jgi:hypothetical protein
MQGVVAKFIYIDLIGAKKANFECTIFNGNLGKYFNPKRIFICRICIGTHRKSYFAVKSKAAITQRPFKFDTGIGHSHTAKEDSDD